MDTRLIISEPLSGPENMAIDEAILQTTAETGAATLRFYRWREPTLSLGYFQSWRDRPEKLADLPLVRRASGGGALVHHHELTYSFASTSQGGEPLYLDFHETLIDAFAEFGIHAARYETVAEREESPDGEQPFLCFQRRSAQDLVIGSAKIVGSAQRRQKLAVLQHGGILLSSSPYTPELPGLNDVSGILTPPEQLIQVWQEKLAARLGLRFHAGHLGNSEKELQGAILARKFSSEGWNLKR